MEGGRLREVVAHGGSTDFLFLLGHFSRFFIQSVTSDGIYKNFGGDAWRVYIRQGPASLATSTTILFSIEDNTTAAVENSFTGADTLWIYGDSVAQNFLKSLRLRGICKKIFKKCKDSYMWIYEV